MDPINNGYVGRNIMDTPGDYGFLSAIYEGYANHWALRTITDGWWYTINRAVAIAIHANSNKKDAKDLFANYDGRKDLTVKVSNNGVDYNDFFLSITNVGQYYIKPIYI